MKMTRKKYHSAVKHAKDNQFDMRKRSLASKIEDGADFWTELQKINPNRRLVPHNIDGAEGAKEIASLFASKYDELYSSTPTSTAEITRLKEAIEANIARDEQYSLTRFSEADVRKNVKRLKKGKGDGSRGFESDHLIHGSAVLFRAISVLFNAMMKHTCSPKHLPVLRLYQYQRTIGPLSLSDSKDYRGITLCNAMCKLYDLIVLSNFKSSLTTTDNQFGFKPKLSTVMCTAVLNETVNHLYM
jgi:hypothetical protein